MTNRDSALHAVPSMTNHPFIGLKSVPYSADVEKGQLKFFAKAVGETNPIYTDEGIARLNGYASLPAPLTFLFSLCLTRPPSPTDFGQLGIDMAHVLHGEQGFEYFEPVCAGDVVTMQGTIVDYYEKRNGQLRFLKEETLVVNQAGRLVAKLTNVAVIRGKPEAAK